MRLSLTRPRFYAANRVRGDIPLKILCSQFKFDGHFALPSAFAIRLQIAEKFYTCHDNTAVVPCAKLCSDHFVRIDVRAKRIFIECEMWWKKNVSDLNPCDACMTMGTLSLWYQFYRRDRLLLPDLCSVFHCKIEIKLSFVNETLAGQRDNSNVTILKSTYNTNASSAMTDDLIGTMLLYVATFIKRVILKIDWEDKIPVLPRWYHRITLNGTSACIFLRHQKYAQVRKNACANPYHTSCRFRTCRAIFLPH